MRKTGAIVTSHFRTGDEIISGDIYTYFDFSYYNHTGETTKLLSKYGVTGYGESSLLYDRANEIVVNDLSSLHPTSGKVWVVGKPGQRDYFDHVPPNWRAETPRYIDGVCAVQAFRVN